MPPFLQPAFRSSLRVSWFDRHRDFFVRQVFADFFTLMLAFQELYKSYCQCRTSRRGEACCLLIKSEAHEQCSIWDQLAVMVGSEIEKGPLWQLKDLCQQIWPEGQGRKIEDSLMDWLLGSIFHEAMKLKEDVHILNSYGSAAFWQGNAAVPTAVSRLTKIIDRKGLIRRVAIDVMRQMEQLAMLFGQTSNMLRNMLPVLAENILLVRFLVEREDLVEYLWSEELTSVFQDMFGRPSQGFCAAGKSYMSGQWYTRALVMYRRAQELDGGCSEAATKVEELQQLIQQTGCCLGAA
jgi:hypothetical protein